jgi:hypothetical protein
MYKDNITFYCAHQLAHALLQIKSQNHFSIPTTRNFGWVPV